MVFISEELGDRYFLETNLSFDSVLRKFSKIKKYPVLKFGAKKSNYYTLGAMERLFRKKYFCDVEMLKNLRVKSFYFGQIRH